MKKYIELVLIFVISCALFYYTDKTIKVFRNQDPLMQEVKNKSLEHNVSAVDAIIDDDEVLSGINGISVNVLESYLNMKQEGNFNSNLLIFEETYPEVSLKDNYDKFVVGGSPYKKNISLVFEVNDVDDNLIDIANVLEKNNIEATFFIDGKYEDSDLSILTYLTNHNQHLENLGYEDTYDKTTIKYTNSLIKRLTLNNSKYCYSKDKDKKVLEVCKKYDMYTITPNIIISNESLTEIKNNLKNGSIISISSKNEAKFIDMVLKYIKQKGYDILSLDNLLNI